MKAKNLFWIIPICLIIGFYIGSVLTSVGINMLMDDYPIIRCIYQLDDYMDVDSNNFPFTKESQRATIQWRCAKEFVNFNITDYEDILDYNG